MRCSWLLVLTPLALAACGDPDVVVANPPQAAAAPSATVVAPAPAPSTTVVAPAPSRSDTTVVVPERREERIIVDPD
jgi:hypothetical protein